MHTDVCVIFRVVIFLRDERSDRHSQHRGDLLHPLQEYRVLCRIRPLSTAGKQDEAPMEICALCNLETVRCVALWDMPAWNSLKSVTATVIH